MHIYIYDLRFKQIHDINFNIPLQDNTQVPDDMTTTDSIVPTDQLISFGESASSMNKADNSNLENGKIYLIQSLVILKIPYAIIVSLMTLLLYVL